ncbi:MAG: cell division protein FtsK [Dactylosporangium sp.]|nr:cell division protein FtsK [Dactylosporangium sp.]NNJ63535.1 cell division protein FtsK [Dactylosporangium sp.]
MADLAFGPPPGEDGKATRIVDLNQRRADRAAAADGLVVADDTDVETTDVDDLVAGGPVDPPEVGVDLRGVLDERRVPILPTWLTHRDELAQTMRWAGGTIGYHTGVHLVRLPIYAGKMAWYAPKGTIRAVGSALGWAAAERGNFALRQDAATRNDARTWLELDRHRQRQAAWRWWVLGAGALGTGAGGLVIYSDLLPWWVRLPALAGGILAASRYGRPVDKPIMARTVRRARYRKLTAELTRRGIMATGEVKRPEDIHFEHEIRREGPGYLAVADLPDGVIATDIIDKRPQLAGGLRLPLDQVWPDVLPREHPSRMALWVADKPVSALKQPRWPLLREATTDYFKPFCYGFDPRMRQVMYQLDERNSLFAGVPGSGKSLSARVVLVGAALDPLVTFAGFDLAGRGDFDMFEPLCAPGLFGSGADDATKQAAYRMILWLLAECDTRGPLIKHYAKQGLNSENKLNRTIATRDPRLRPIVAWIDEVQELITDPELGKAVKAALISIIKRGRALGIHLVLMTQRIDAPSLPKGVTSNIALRTCLAVPSHTEVELALGTGTYRAGARPTAFEIGVDAGWGVRVGYGPMTTVRAAYLDRSAVERLCTRGLALRGGTVEAADLPPERDLLADVLAVIDPGREGIHRDPCARALADRWPGVYGQWTADMLSSRLGKDGVRTVTVNLGGDRQRGWRREHLTTAIEARTDR